MGGEEEGAVGLVLTPATVGEVVADPLGVQAGPVITTELTRLVHLQVEAEGAALLPGVSAVAVNKPPAVEAEGEVVEAVLEHEDQEVASVGVVDDLPA